MTASTRADFQTSIRLPQAIHERLVAAAEANSWSVGEEMRRRLIVSFDEEPLPRAGHQSTTELLVAIGRMAALLADWFGPWHDDEFAATIFLRAVSKLIVLRTNWRDHEESRSGTARIRPKPGSPGMKLFERNATVTTVSAALVGSVQGTGGEC